METPLYIGICGNPYEEILLTNIFSLREDAAEESFKGSGSSPSCAMRPESSLKPASEQKKTKKLPSGDGGTVNQAFSCV